MLKWLTPNVFEPVRLEFYASKLFIGQDIRGADKTFDDLKESYQIAILGKKHFFNDDVILHKFEYYDSKHNVSLNGRSRIITVELSKLDKIVEKPVKDMNPVEQWAVFFRYLTDKAKREKINEIIECQEGIAMASEVLVTFTKDEIEHYHRESILKHELDTQSRIVDAKRKALRKNDEKWQKVVTDKDATIAGKDATIADKDAKLADITAENEHLRSQLAKYQGTSSI